MVVGPGWGMQRFVFGQDWGRISVPRRVAQRVSGEKVVAAAQLLVTWMPAPVCEDPGPTGSAREDPRTGPEKEQSGIVGSTGEAGPK